MSNEEEASLCFQDLLKSEYYESDDRETQNVANVFFELANAKTVKYRISDENDDSSNPSFITIGQDIRACGQHTGGIIWETSYLLLDYLLRARKENSSRQSRYKKVIEVGAGCGLLGLGLHRSKIGERVWMTETNEVMANLLTNVKRNSESGSLIHQSKASSEEEANMSYHFTNNLHACCLDWTRYKADCDDAGIKAHSMDLVVGTDVVFSTRLVVPLLQTLRYLSNEKTLILLCLQERCKDSHEMLINECSDHGLKCEDISTKVTQTPGCEWGNDLECRILQFTAINVVHKSNT